MIYYKKTLFGRGPKLTAVHELQSNELVQERHILQHLTKRKINEMSHIPHESYADWGDD